MDNIISIDKQSNNINVYMLDPIYGNHNNACRNKFGLIDGNRVSTVVNSVDLESDLRGQIRKQSLCPEKKYNKKNAIKYKLNHLPTCEIINLKSENL